MILNHLKEKGNLMDTLTYSPGLKGVIAAETRLSHIDGENGRLIIGGYPLEEIAPHATYEDMLYLLWHDRLPADDESRAFQAEIAAQRALPPVTLAVVRAMAGQPVMDVLRAAAGTLPAAGDPYADMLRVVAAFPVIVPDRASVI